MTVKVTVKQDTVYPDLKVIYTDNCITDGLVNKVKEIIENESKVRVSFDVMGATLHDILSYQLKERLPEYYFYISRYKCKIFKEEQDV